jgi:hypothetical protein
MEINNFDVLKRMSKENKDIRLGTDVLNLKKVKAGTQITIGIAGDVITPVFLGEMNACLILFNKNQFDELKDKMETESGDGD